MQMKLTAFSRAEVLQYLGWRGSDIPLEVDRQIDSCMADTLRTADARYTWKKFSIDRTGGEIRLAGTDVCLPGDDIAALLADCEQCVLLAATLGGRLEPLIRRAEVQDMTRAIILDCCGSAAIEAVCDKAEEEICASLGEQARFLTDRFSPGYGDMPITCQPMLVRLLDTGRFPENR